MRRFRLRQLIIPLLLAACAATLSKPASAESRGEAVKLTGAGATFPAPLYLRWFRDYYKAHPDVQVDYTGLGSAAGMRELIQEHVDFAGSDLPLTEEQIGQIPGGIRQAPMAGGGIILIYNLDGIEDLKLSRKALVGIFSGTIQRWNDPDILSDNPGAELPDIPIVIVTRGGASGTSYKLTRHLSAIDPAFAAEVGPSMTPSWPRVLQDRAGQVGARGNDGVAASVLTIPGSIGYVESALDRLPNMHAAILQNRSGAFIKPDTRSFEAALNSIIQDSQIATIADPPGTDVYPMLGLSWLILPARLEDPAKLDALNDVLQYALGPGQDVAEQLGYIRFPASLISYAREQLKLPAQ